MKLEVGMYVRTKCGYIAKLIDVDYEEEYYEFDKGIVWFYEYLKDTFSFDSEDLKQITKASHNIIDLIEVGDVITTNNLCGQVTCIDGDKIYTTCYDGDCCYDYQIQSIVTKEQFSSMEYRVGE